MRIGLFGGSFNPIHNGHIALAEQMLVKGALDEVWFMVSPQNPLKKQDDLAPDDVRYSWVEQALSDHPRLIAKDYEFHLPRPSYTWKTLQELRKDFPGHEFVLIIGADNWVNFSRWAHHDDILRDYDILVYPRHGYSVDTESMPKNVLLVDTPMFNVSSTQIRKLLKEGKSVEGLVPKGLKF